MYLACGCQGGISTFKVLSKELAKKDLRGNWEERNSGPSRNRPRFIAAMVTCINWIFSPINSVRLVK